MLKRLFPVFISIFSLLFALLVVELAVRWIFSSKVSYKTDRPQIHYLPEASKSTRDYKYDTRKAKNTFRIITIGDSFTFGYGNTFDDAYPKRLERLLNLNATTKRVEVINLGTPGASTWNEVEILKKGISLYQPDLVLLQITLNDPEIRPYLAPRGAFSSKVKSGFWSHWKTLQFVASRLSNTESVRRYMEYFKGLYKDPETINRFKDSLTSMNALARQKRILITAVVFPLLSFPLDEKYPFKEEHLIIHSILQERSMPYLDLFNAYKGMDPLRLQAVPPGYPNSDPHPNEIAHRIAAEEIYRSLARQKLIPSESVVKCRIKRRLSAHLVRCR